MVLKTLKQVIQLLKKQDYGTLLAADQLVKQIKVPEKGSIFEGFVEKPISFPPTYKFTPMTSHYDRRRQGKQRIPAWCDRIIHRTNGQSGNIRQHFYQAASLLSSDHKPVVALYELLVSSKK
jgi:hypothetical protein